jgi:cell division protein FtsQ
MTARLPRRYPAAAGRPRRQPRIRRASARLTPIRAAAILAMLLASGAIYGLAATRAFGFVRLEITGIALTPAEAIRGAVDLELGANLVSLATGPIVERLRALPAIGEASVAVGLPDLVSVTVHERVPIVIWATADHRFAVDESGLLFAEVGANAADPVAGLPVVVDGRSASADLVVRSFLDPVDLDAATRLGSVTPAQIGSHAASLSVAVTDERGFTVSSGAQGWLAVFGFFGRSQRTPALIPAQVQLLAALLAGREDTVATVILADGREGTYIPKPTPHASPTPRPSVAP